MDEETGNSSEPGADAAETVRRVAESAGARAGLTWREVRLGTVRLEAELLGEPIEREQELGRLVIEPALAERLQLGDVAAETELRDAILDAREHARISAEEELRHNVDTLRPLLEALPPDERPGLLGEAAATLENADRSTRKLRKRIRQFLLALRLDERRDALASGMPGLRVVELRGGARFELARTLGIRILDQVEVRVPVTASEAGGELEDLFLIGTVDDFLAAARARLEAELDAAETRWRAAGDEVERFVADRGRRRFYDRERLRDIVVEELESVGGRRPDDVLRAIRARTRRLDAVAREREAVWRLIRERRLFDYKDSFPLARTMERKLVLYIGPTNSGKTWHALNLLSEASSGVYLAPLRLLALEGQEEVEKRGPACSYITGEERQIREGASFVASTIEMLDPSREVDVAVIDEVQLLADDDRGWAWCQALVGVPARTVVMTGSPDAVPLVEAIAEYLDEPLEVHRLERFTPLEPLHQPARLSEVEPGTALIAFSRREVLRLKAQLTGRHQVAVIYGNLTPEVRREEARRFRAGDAQVLVATDAIAMGLNLPIRTVLFTTLRKWNGREEVDLTDSQMLQIGGRAGRFGKHERGFVGALHWDDLRRIRGVFRGPLEGEPLAKRTQVRPLGLHIEVLADGVGTESLKKALVTFQRGMTFDSPLFGPGVTDDMIALAEVVDAYPEVPLKHRLTLSCAPVDAANEFMVLRYEGWVDAFAAGRESRLPGLRQPFGDRAAAATDEELHSAEMEAKTLTVYAWLAYRYPDAFPDLDECQAQRETLDGFIERSLARAAGRRRCRECGDALPGRSRHPMCENCYRKQRAAFRGAKRGGKRAGRRRR